MKITNLEKSPLYSKLFEKDLNNREINLYKLSNVIPCGESLFYPNPLFFSKKENVLYSPINETTMSLKDITHKKEYFLPDIEYTKTEKHPLFFFVYNTDNYYHFIYDTLPYLISFFKLKETIPDVKLLMNYPNETKKEFYKFIIEFLDILGIKNNDIKIINDNTVYETLYISDSYTHGHDSNLPPRNEIFDFYKSIADTVNIESDKKVDTKKIYISRRSWKHGDFSNIGTNYTTRRKMVNEDDLVEYLETLGYVEVFAETMSTKEKILLFSNADKIVGAIGGGLCNVVFSSKKCDLISIVSPYFLHINNRFKYSLSCANLKLFDIVEHVEKTEFKKYMRVKYKDIVGEIINVYDNEVEIAYANKTISGWNNEINFNKINVNKNDCTKLDDGLNSSFEINLNEFKKETLL